MSRIDGFEGSDKDYITFLETQIRELRIRCYHCRPLQVPPLAASASSSPHNANTKKTVEKDRGLQVKVWQPPPPKKRRTQPARPARPPCATPARHAEALEAPDLRWKDHAKKLVESTPPAQKWKEGMKEKGLYDIMSTSAAAAYFFKDEYSPSVSTNLSLGTQHGSDFLDQMAHYAKITVQKHESAKVAVMLANFQKFILLSACAVAIANTDDSARKEAIFNIVRICMGSCSDEYCRRILGTVVYMNRLVDTLAIHGFDGRAAELLLLCM